jgi:hypothetical protein
MSTFKSRRIIEPSYFFLLCFTATARRFRISVAFLQTSAMSVSAQKCVLGAQLVEQCFCLFQVDGVEALGKPIVDFSKQGAGFLATALTDE